VNLLSAVESGEKTRNGLRYLRVGGRGQDKDSRAEKCSGVGNCLRLPQTRQRQVHALLGGVLLCKTRWLLMNLRA